MPKVSEEHRARQRERIADAAYRCFVRDGFHQTSMANIIAESELSAGAIYNHFAGKRDIIVTVALRSILPHLMLPDSANSDSSSPVDPRFQVRELLSGLGTIERDAVSVIVQIWGQAALDDELLALIRERVVTQRVGAEDNLAAWATEQLDLPPARIPAFVSETTQLTMSLGMGMLVQRIINPEFDLTTYLDAADKAITGVLAASGDD